MSTLGAVHWAICCRSIEQVVFFVLLSLVQDKYGKDFQFESESSSSEEEDEHAEVCWL